jgi:hypothetical protein
MGNLAATARPRTVEQEDGGYKQRKGAGERERRMEVLWELPTALFTASKKGASIVAKH